MPDNHTDHCCPYPPHPPTPPPHPYTHTHTHTPFHITLQGAFGPIFLGDVSSQWETRGGISRGTRRFIGCMRELRANSKEIYLLAEGARGRNIKNCEPPVCQHRPCRNGGTCVRYEVAPRVAQSVSKRPLNSKVVPFTRKPPFPISNISPFAPQKKTLLCLIDA